MTSGVTCSITLQYRMAPNYRIQLNKDMGSLNKSSPCQICCGKNPNLKIHHIHFSTTYYNKQRILKGDTKPMCYYCDLPHTIDQRTRQSVILSDSTLSGVPYMEGWGWGEQTPTHCDMETIPGGKIITLRKAWERAYHSNPLAIDTVLVAGLNDIRDLARLYKDKHDMPQMVELISTDVMDAIKSLHQAIKAHSKHWDTEDTLAVGTILHVPAMYWHEADGEYPSFDYNNLKEVVDKTNLKIEAFNLENGSPSTHTPKLHQAGERGLKVGGGKTVKMYIFQAWREEEKQAMMHLKDPHRFKMTKMYAIVLHHCYSKIISTS